LIYALFKARAFRRHCGNDQKDQESKGLKGLKESKELIKW
jgi:hypothetical protein